MKKIKAQIYRILGIPEIIKEINRCMKYGFKDSIKVYLRNIPNHRRWREESKDIVEKSIKVYGLHDGRIGETISRYLMYSRKLESNDTNVLISYNVPKENSSVLTIINRNIPIIYEETYPFWQYVLIKYKERLSENSILYLDRGDPDEYISPEWSRENFLMSHVEQREGQGRAAKLGVNRDFVCIYNRDSAYLGNNTKSEYHSYRDFPISDMYKVAEYCGKKSLLTVRMGAEVEKPVDFGNCIDYGSMKHDDLLDVYFFWQCKFAVGAESGINLLAKVIDKPYVTVNLCGPASGYGNIPCNNESMVIYKRVYSIQENRYLNLYETMTAHRNCAFNTEQYKKRKLELINNTPEEIVEVTREMNDRLDGIWTETEEEKALQSQYREIVEKWILDNGENKYNYWIGRIGTDFIKRHRYLLEQG